MATRSRVASPPRPPRKRRSSDKDRQDLRKKRKDSTNSSRKQKSKHSKSSKKAPSSGLKVRTVTELAELVASGAVRVPQGLEHYVSDRRQLLDQVFTILGPGDVSGMLPDVLKGLKMKRVKALCLTKLQSMSEQDIISVIQTTDSPPEVDLNQTIMQLLGQSSSASQTVGTGEVETGDTTEDTTEALKMDIEIAVSDVSDDEQGANKDTPCNNKSEEIEDPMDSNTVTTVTSEAPVTSPLNNTSEQLPTKHATEDGASSDSEAEDLTEDVNQALEMELRQRALESALKKATHCDKDSATEGDNSGPEPEMQYQEEGTVTNTMLQEVVRSDGSASGYNTKAVGDMVEQRLREKLLQSLAAKR